MVIFSHRGIGFGPQENSLEALRNAVENGFSVEVDLRIIKNDIILLHDFNSNKPLADFEGLLKLIRNNPDVNFALHLKDDSIVLFDRVGNSIKDLKNCFIFVTDFAQERFISDMYTKLGSRNLAFYATEEALGQALLRKVEYLWIDETKARIYDKLNYFLSFDKKVVCCSPELFMSDYNARLNDFHKIVSLNRQSIFGVCTDFYDSFTGLEDI